MKKLLFSIVFLSLFITNCSSDGDSQNIDSEIIANGIEFVPTKLKVSNGVALVEGEAALDFSLTKGSSGSSNYEALTFKINYPLTSSSAPNGTYEFGIGETGTMLFAQGSYIKGSTTYILAGYPVKVTSLGNDKFKLEFQNIQAVNPSDFSQIIISGYCEGKFQ